jgi:hypothetical protein
VPPYTFKKEMYHVEYSQEEGDFPLRDLHILDGTMGPSGGTVSVHEVNGTWADTTMTFSAPYHLPGPSGQFTVFSNITLSIRSGEKQYSGRAQFLFQPGSPLFCIGIQYYKRTLVMIALLNKGPNPPPPKPRGNCTVYRSVTSTRPAADNSTTSGGAALVKASYVFYPSWPASSPWVTAVGATRFVGQKVGGEEMASDQFGSGGGFSSMFNDTSKYAWQADAVAKYVQTGPTLDKWPPNGSFLPTGRATPDIAALGEGYQVYVGGQVQSVGGTSASSPAFAGFVSLLNEARFKAGKPQMGFANPFFYKNPDVFSDVTKGTNAIGRGTGPLKYGFAAAPGWDAATGLGTPRFDKMLAAALKA